MVRIDVFICEREDCWRVSYHAPDTDRFDDYPTAAEAFASLQGRARELAVSGSSSVMRVTWEPSTRVGVLVIAAIKADAEEKRR